jgi:hypothetical protein
MTAEYAEISRKVIGGLTKMKSRCR